MAAADNTFHPSISVFLVLQKEGEILLHKRINTHHENGNYGLVAGHLDGNETIQQGVAREAKEEAGIDVDVQDLEVVHVMHSKGDERYGEYFNFYLACSKWNGEVKNMEPDRCGDLAWFPIDELPENTIFYIRQALECIDKKIFYSNFGW